MKTKTNVKAGIDRASPVIEEQPIKSERSRPARRLFKLHVAKRIGLQDPVCGAISAVRCCA